jgi:D-alanyl-D-alanine carboxypeptidase/D-alanyl-D-alanine-endopeptidase (penicillin-binding protein 4)
MTRRLAAIALILTLGAGCAHQPRPATTPKVTPPKRGVKALRADLTAGFAAPAFSNAVWGVVVRSIRTGETLYAQNPRTFLMPASNMKVVTMAAAADRLGWDYTFQTRVVAIGAIDGLGALHGDLVIVGSGDPSLGGRPTAGPAVVDAWADQIRAAGITAIDGRVIGDDNAFDDEALGAGWAWDYLSAGYAAPIGGLEFNENVVQVVLKPGAAAGDPVTAEVRPDTSGLAVEVTARTGAKEAELDLSLSRLPGSRTLRVTGTIPTGRAEVTRTVSVDNPTMFMAGALRRALVAKGIAVSGEAVDVDSLPAVPDLSSAQTLVTCTSPTLAEIGKVLLKVSQNLYADTLLKRIGQPAPGATGAPGAPATTSAGIKAVQEVLARWGISADRYVQADGSGLSRYNYLTADVLATVLARVVADERLRAAFVDGLPVAGVDGTIASRMKNTKAQGNARAKTGSISNARALSGFVTSADGEPLVFSMIVNNFNVPQSDADAIIDRAVVRLAEFRR